MLTERGISYKLAPFLITLSSFLTMTGVGWASYLQHWALNPLTGVGCVFTDSRSIHLQVILVYMLKGTMKDISDIGLLFAAPGS